MAISGDLLKRIASTLILAPIVLYVVWLGGWPFWGLVLIAFSICVYEGLSLSMRTRWPLLFAPITVLYLATSITSFVLVRDLGPMPVFALLIAVWMTDICAYGAGRLIGGPKMAPTVSPNKTWAGLLGGMAGAVATFIIFAHFTSGYENITNLIVLGIIIALVGQIGDLMESFLKRQAGAKDSGNLIPGHGGLLDRIDGLLLCAPIFLVSLKGLAG